MQEKPISEKESLVLITQMINKAKNSYHDTGLSAMLWGAVIIVCSLVRFAEIRFDFELPFDIYLLTIAAIVPQVIISIREKKSRQVRSYDDQYMDYIWLGFGISIMLMIFVLNMMGASWQPVAKEFLNETGRAPGFQLYEYISPLFLILYGIPTFVTGTACKFRPMLWGGLVCWIACIISSFTPIQADLLLVAFSSLVAWFIPGIIMMKDYKAAKLGLERREVEKNV
jgi:hypothetical protein